MKNPPNNQESQKVSPKEIAECIFGKLGVEIDQDFYREVIVVVEEAFELYEGLLKGAGVGILHSDRIEKLGNAISLLEHLKIYYVASPEYDLDELQEKYVVGGEDTTLVIGDSVDEKKRRRDIQAVQRHLRNLREELLAIVDNDNPFVMVARKNPKSWWIWRLFNSLREAFPGHALPNTQIRRTVYRLLELYGVQEKESSNPERMIREQYNRFQEKIEPHLSPPE